MKKFFIQLISDQDGNVSSMRFMFILVVTGCCLGYFVLMLCLIHVVFTKDDFPNGFWQAMVSLTTTIGAAFGTKSMQSSFEVKKSIATIENKPPAPEEGSEPS